MIPITLTCADYARVMPLATGEVKPEGIALTMVLGSRGSWPARAEMLRRAVQDPAVQGGEWSMAQYLYRIDKGDRRFVGLPVFPLRNFTARDLYVRRGGPIREPKDLAGKRIGMYSYSASGSIWYRHFLRFVGLDPAAIQWWIGDIDAAWSSPMDPNLPAGVKTRSGRALALRHADRRRAGGRSTARRARRPTIPGPGASRACSRTSAGSSRSTSAQTGAFPPQHLIVLRREVWEANRWIARQPDRGVRRRQRRLHGGPAGVSVRHAVAGGRAGGHRGRDGRGLPPARARAATGPRSTCSPPRPSGWA